MAGASAVQLGTILFVEPDAGLTVWQGLKERLIQAQVRSLSELVGTIE